MKRFFVVLSVLLVSQFVLGGIDFLGVDGVQTNFVADTGVLSMSGSSLVITLSYDDGTPQSSISPGTFSLNSTLDSGMHFIGGTFEFTDTSNVLLSGNVTSIDFNTFAGLITGSGAAEVLVENLEGNLLGNAEIVTLSFNISPPVQNFDADFQGLSKVNFLVPEPATLAILSLGGILLRRKK